ncbi:hypothetical protein [Limosilactobacillus mucosae]|uniref:hypothetical protein n=1 Tax=Limosilactobacillus mucosae TaxID=97478 RepID=UPI0025A432A0|nr:hypothetical protein [Limosilactobacillus mucosae]MDD6893840.1 hypothetical protein [Lactobacillus sp.]MDM8219615.1 hypothetical protein [Limosilactobacillus mucosae]MDM8314271.1 hypothetical protein [Limosilactobacillus mucosae]
MNEENRYVQPKNAKEAMELIQKLFNQYRNAPLTAELLQYHNNLIMRLQTDIKQAAEAEGQPALLKDLHEMTELMRRWTTIRLSGRPFAGKMRHFHFVANNGQKFKRQVHKMGGSSAHRASRH